MEKQITKAIGVIGGVGPSAGCDLLTKIIKHTKASKDQDHISTFLTSCPEIIPDRTGYLLEGGENPAPGIQKCFEILANCGATAIGICCNTAHAPRILNQVNIPNSTLFINMIESTCLAISERFGSAKIGLLSTLGTNKTGLYDEYFAKYPELQLIKPEMTTAEKVHDAIYNSVYGIKTISGVSKESQVAVQNAVLELKNKGCKAVILGCTELPIVFPNETEYENVVLVDPTDELAKALIKATYPEKLI